MLIRLVTSNFLSFKDETEFNMLTSDGIRRKSNHKNICGNIEVLKTAAIYGPNGAGKSNLVYALKTMQELVSDDESLENFMIPSFKMNKNYKSKPSKFEVEFCINGKTYSYGFSVWKNKFIEEWLYLTSQESEELIFSRQKKENKVTIEVNDLYYETPEEKLRIQIYEEELLKDDILLLSLFAKAKKVIPDIENAYNWFSNGLIIIEPLSKVTGFSLFFHFDIKFKEYINSILTTLQTGVDKITLLSIDLFQYFGEDDKELAKRILEKLKDGDSENFWPISEDRHRFAFAIIEDGKPVVKRLVTQHLNSEDEYINFEVEEESDGTQRLLDFLPAFFHVISEDVTFVIDEIDQSIHPALLKKLVAKFVNAPNTKGQLIFTTHESNLLDQDIFRQDEIWFAEKKKTGETTLYPLSEYTNIRNDLDIRKGYLNGRFGAIPFLGNLDDLNWNQYAPQTPSV